MHRSISEIYDFYEVRRPPRGAQTSPQPRASTRWAPSAPFAPRRRRGRRFYIVMEFVDGGELLDKIVDDGPLGETAAAEMIRDIGGALALLHAQGMCHSDIKPRTCCSPRTARGGWSTSACRSTSRRRAARATTSRRSGAAPCRTGRETIERSRMGLPADMWALGVVLFMTLGGYHPFDAYVTRTGGAVDEDLAQTVKNILTSRSTSTPTRGGGRG